MSILSKRSKMSGTTLEEATAARTAAYNAYLDALNNQSYSISGRSLSRQNISDLWEQVRHWDRLIDELSGAQEIGFSEGGVLSG